MRQRLLDSERTDQERNALGQFATPTELALDIARYVARLWKERNGEKIRFLEPALGSGSFYSALLQTLPLGLWESATGIELDPRFVRVARELWSEFGLTVVEGDFTQLPAPFGDAQKANLLVTNPPYVRHHHLGPETKLRLQKAVLERVGLKLSGLAGLYCYFMLLADAWLAKHGLSVWLIPSEFLAVNYGDAVREYLASRVTLLHIHVFDANDLQFEDALVSSSIVVFEKRIPPPNHVVTLSRGGKLSSPADEILVPLRELRKTGKWLKWLDEDRTYDGKEIALGELFTVKRGIATGANDFFVMTREEAVQRGIPSDFLRPVLPAPRYLRETVIAADKEGYPALSQQLVLLDCHLPEKVVAEEYPALWAYLEEGKTRGVSARYLTAKRVPWYRQEPRPPAPFLCTYMGRGSHGGKPFRFIWNQSKAVATNVYLCLYPSGIMAEALERDGSLYAVIFDLLNGISEKDFKSEGRVYGGGLYKIEPAELGRISAGRFLDALRNVTVERNGHYTQVSLL